jgi:hypothetical protein
MPATAPTRRPASKTAAKVAPKTAPAARQVPAAQAPVPDKPVKPAKAEKPAKVRRKPVRDGFTMPEADFSLIATLKARALSARREAKKSELLRAGLHALAALPTPALVTALNQLDPVKVGRPRKD